MSHTFYSDLPAVDRFAEIAEPSHYAPVPDGWSIVVTDVEGSTEAVKAGRYRDVNYVGAASIAAVLNLAGETEVPFVFGGDGATLLLPPSLLGPARGALAALRIHTAESLGLTLRAGVVPVEDVRAAGERLAVMKLAVSPHYAQAMFTGGGLAHAERLVKAPATHDRYAILTSEAATGDDPYAGLECRWQDVRSERGETVTLLVTAHGANDAERLATYRAVIEFIEATYGPDTVPHPISPSRLRLSWDPRRFSSEVRLRSPKPRRLRQRLTLWALNLLGIVLIRLGIVTSETDWKRYPVLLREATDYRKFDDTLRMVLAGTPSQRRHLEAYLDERYRAGGLAYGVHVSDRAVLTCLVHERMGRQVHFVDGAGGGYTSASVALKRRTRTLTPSG